MSSVRSTFWVLLAVLIVLFPPRFRPVCIIHFFQFHVPLQNEGSCLKHINMEDKQLCTLQGCGVGFLRTLAVGVDFLYDSDSASPTE